MTRMLPPPRVTIAIDVDLTSESQFFTGLSGDIAEGGLFFATYRPLPIGSTVALELSLPGVDRPLLLTGTVAWLRDHSLHHPRGVGIAFDALSRESRKHIRAFLTSRPALYYEL